MGVQSNKGAIMAMRVVVADDDPGVLDALVAVLDTDDRFTVVAQLTSGAGVLESVVAEQADAVVLDVRMPVSGLDALRALRAADLAVVVVVISARFDQELVSGLLADGACGVLLKGRLGTSLPDVLERCCGGEVVLST
jgi:DNA-binding NarL/FixJ family response regulator